MIDGVTYNNVPRSEDDDHEYEGEMYYSYFNGDDADFMVKRLYEEEGTFENQTVYGYFGEGETPQILSEDATIIVAADTEGYVEPHVSLCKDTMKMNYNKEIGDVRVYAPSDWNPSYASDPRQLKLWDNNGKLLVELNSTKREDYINIPYDNIIISDTDMLVFNDDEYGTDPYESNWDIGEFKYNVPSNTTAIMFNWSV